MVHRSLRGRIAVLGCAVLLAACGGTGTPAPTATQVAAMPGPTAFNGQAIALSVKNLVFSESAVTVKAGAAFEIMLDNQDELSHAIYVTPGKRPITMLALDEYEKGPYPFKGEYVQAHKTITYHVGALSPGAYQFFCPPHQDMVISVTVE